MGQLGFWDASFFLSMAPLKVLWAIPAAQSLPGDLQGQDLDFP